MPFRQARPVEDLGYPHWYSGWKKSCTTLDGWNSMKNGINMDKPPINWCRISSIHSIMEVPETLGTSWHWAYCIAQLSMAQPPKQWLDRELNGKIPSIWNIPMKPPQQFYIASIPHEMPKPPQWFCMVLHLFLAHEMPWFFTRTCWSSSPPPSKWFQDPNLRDCFWRSQLKSQVSPISVANCGSTVELPQEWRHQRFDPTILKHRQGKGTRFRARFWFGCLWEQLTIKCCRLRWACAFDLQCISESALKCLAADRPAKWTMESPIFGGFDMIRAWPPSIYDDFKWQGPKCYTWNIFKPRNGSMLRMQF